MTDRDAVRFLETGALCIGALVLFAHLVLILGLLLAVGAVVLVGLLAYLWRF